jgi:hypothetical protein
MLTVKSGSKQINLRSKKRGELLLPLFCRLRHRAEVFALASFAGVRLTPAR